jgi:predicted nucleotidyltransferase
LRNSNVPEDYDKIIRSLDQHQVEYIVIGGMAAVTLGAPIVTRDLDICYRQSRENAARLAAALAAFHPRLRGVDDPVPFKLDGPTIEHGCNFTLCTDAGDLDLLGHVTGLGGYGQIRPNALPVSIYGCRVLVMSLEDLIKAKKAAGREKDKSQLTTLEETLRQIRKRAGR